MRSGTLAAVALSALGLGACRESPVAPNYPIVAARVNTGSPANLRGRADRHFVVMRETVADASAFADSITTELRAEKGRVWSGLRIAEVAGLSPEAVQSLRALPGIIAVDPAEPFLVQDQQQLGQYQSQWGLDLIDQHSWVTNQIYSYFYTGSGTHVYIIDTGIQCQHYEFTVDVNCWGEPWVAENGWWPWTDDDGHGTNMASVAAGASTGIARGTTLHSVKVGEYHEIDHGDLVDGIYWVSNHAVHPAVASISIAPADGTLPVSTAMAVNVLANSGVTVSLAAGNGGPDQVGDDACSHGYDMVHDAVIIMSAASFGANKMSYANYGACVDLFAPGDGLRAAEPYFAFAYTDYAGGTSAATAIGAGVAATVLQQTPSASPTAVQAQMIGGASQGLLFNIGAGSPNRFINSINLYYPTPLTGPTQVVTTTTQTVSWTVYPVGGSGAYSYVWEASVNGGPWTTVGTTQTYSRFFRRFEEYQLALRVTVSSASALTYVSPGNHYVDVTCGGC